jgi:hypothetical protein
VRRVLISAPIALDILNRMNLMPALRQSSTRPDGTLHNALGIIAMAFAFTSCVYAQAPRIVTIVVDNSGPHQRIEGFGATTESLVFGTVDNMTPREGSPAARTCWCSKRMERDRFGR